MGKKNQDGLRPRNPKWVHLEETREPGLGFRGQGKMPGVDKMVEAALGATLRCLGGIEERYGQRLKVGRGWGKVSSEEGEHVCRPRGRSQEEEWTEMQEKEGA